MPNFRRFLEKKGAYHKYLRAIKRAGRIRGDVESYIDNTNDPDPINKSLIWSYTNNQYYWQQLNSEYNSYRRNDKLKQARANRKEPI
jgi:hypothetical protein